jgi:hypothetical protein
MTEPEPMEPAEETFSPTSTHASGQYYEEEDVLQQASLSKLLSHLDSMEKTLCSLQPGEGQSSTREHGGILEGNDLAAVGPFDAILSTTVTDVSLEDVAIFSTLEPEQDQGSVNSIRSSHNPDNQPAEVLSDSERDEVRPGNFALLMTHRPACMVLVIAGAVFGFVWICGIPELQQGFEGYDARTRHEALVSDGNLYHSSVSAPFISQHRPLLQRGGVWLTCYIHRRAFSGYLG